ncbi:thiolase family protein [Mycobacterium marseillense]|nr:MULTISPECIES: thiolase family protein [Mycobacterium avium complex (MAC)]MDM3973550.1 thiolase family protein [Mycobacterium marseillense]
MRDAVLVDAVRTPIGKRNGALKDVHPVDLSAHVLNALVDRTGIDPGVVDDVIWGCVTQTGEQSINVGRNAVLAAGWPESVPATTVDRQCGSSQQAAHFAAAGVMSGQYDVAVAGGVESMTRIPMLITMTDGPGSPYSPRVRERYDDGLVGQGISSEIIAKRWGISRDTVDRLALTSHERAAAAIDEGRFKGQIAPIEVPAEGGTLVVDGDEGVRRGGTIDTMAGLKSVFQQGGVTTAGNSSQISDGSGALLIMTSEKASSLGLTPLARFHSFALAGVNPITMLSGPIPATRKVLERAGLRLEDIGVFEVNEAFGTVVAAWLKEFDADPALLNPNGGAIALGHPLGGTGAILMTKLVHHMADQGIRYGLQAICEGGGTANAIVLELL